MPNTELRTTGCRVIICGGRDWNERDMTCAALDRLHRKHRFTTVIHGAAKGADTMAGNWAQSRGIPVIEFPADWNTFGRSAGHRRNQQMLDEGHPDLVVALPGGVGTASMIAKSKAAGVTVINLADIRRWWTNHHQEYAAA